MAPLQHSCLRKVILLYLLLLLFITSSFISAYHHHHQLPKTPRRVLLEVEDVQQEDEPIIKKKTTSSTPKVSSKNQTKLIKPTSVSSKNQTKIAKNTGPTNGSFKNQTKLVKDANFASSKNKTKDSAATALKSQLKKLNSTSKSSTNSTNKSSDLTKLASSKTKTTIKETKAQSEKPKPDKAQPKKPQKKLPSWIDQDDDEEDLVSEFRDLPSKFQESFIPDMEKISKTSQVYLTKYNKEFTKGFKPYVGNKYASAIASLVSFAFIVIPLILVSLIFSRIKAYFSLQKLLIFIQVYLAIYFTILCLSSLVTGLEPLRFFYATSQSTYVCVQVLQTLAYVLYLLLLLMYLILVFSTECGLATKMLGLAQTFVGFAVGLHYYMTVFHRAVLRHPPKTSWKVHALYATCFLAICLLGRVDRRKKAYMEEGGEEGKKS